MATAGKSYTTSDGTKVTAVLVEEGEVENATAPVWVVTFPDGETRYVHPTVFDNGKGI